MLKPKPQWLKNLFPWEQKAITVNGRAMAYIDEGDSSARPVLLLSGNPTWGFLYRDFVQPLTDGGFRAIAPDWVGSGYSDHPRVDGALTFAHHIADLVSLIDQLKLRGFVVVGQDWGRAAGRWGGLATLGKAFSPCSHEYLAVHRLCRTIPFLASSLDNLACAPHRSILHEAS